MNTDKAISLWDELPQENKYSVINEVDNSALISNVKNLKKLLNINTKIMAVVKANAYGHGAVKISKKISYQVDYFGVSRISEAIELRKNKITKPILILGGTNVELTEVLCLANITQAVHTIEIAKAFSEKAIQIGHKLKVHIKIDTGLGRFGLMLHKQRTKIKQKEAIEKVTEEIYKIISLEGLDVEGIYTHCAATNLKNINGLKKQVNVFNSLIEYLNNKGITFKYIHAISSFGLFNLPSAQFNMVRLGKSLYGITPITDKKIDFKLKPILKIKTKIASIKTVPKGTKIGYGYNYITSNEAKIATVPFGFADGCIWEPKQTLMNVLIKGKRIAIIGRICMDFIMLDVSNIDEVAVGDEVVIVGKSDSEEIKLEDIAFQTRTIPTYVATSLDSRTPKMYIN